MRKTYRKLTKKDLIISEDDYYINIKLEKTSDDLFVLNKRIKAIEFGFSLAKSLTIDFFLQTMNDHLIWINNQQTELISFYNNNYEQIKKDSGKLAYGFADEIWYDKLTICSAGIDINEKGDIDGLYWVYDLLNENRGYELEFKNESIVSFQFNPNL